MPIQLKWEHAAKTIKSRSIKFALRGVWLLITTEASIKAQLFFALIATFLGFYFTISATEWMIQFLVIGIPKTKKLFRDFY